MMSLQTKNKQGTKGDVQFGSKSLHFPIICLFIKFKGANFT